MRSLIVIGLLTLCSCATRSVERYAEWERECNNGNNGDCKALKKYCDKGDEPACAIIARNQLRSGGWELAEMTVKRSCELGNAESCEHVRNADLENSIKARPEYASGKIPARNYDSLRTKCKLNDTESCIVLHLDCENSVAKACAIVGQESSLKGKEEKAILYLKQACVLGDADSCKSVTILSGIKANDDARVERNNANTLNTMMLIQGMQRPVNMAPVDSYIKSFQPEVKPTSNCVSTPQYLFGKFNGYTTTCN